MMQTISKSIFLLFVLVGLVCGVYPGVLWLIGQHFFSFQANGSLLLGPNGNIVGSKCIAQPFTQDQYFKPRPSAANYNAAASNASSLAVSNPMLRERIIRTIENIPKNDHDVNSSRKIAADRVTTSASGLDPHITLQNAADQLPGIAASWAKTLNKDVKEVQQTIQALLQNHVEAPFGGLAGEKMINVLEVNLALHKAFGV